MQNRKRLILLFLYVDFGILEGRMVHVRRPTLGCLCVSKNLLFIVIGVPRPGGFYGPPPAPAVYGPPPHLHGAPLSGRLRDWDTAKPSIWQEQQFKSRSVHGLCTKQSFCAER